MRSVVCPALMRWGWGGYAAGCSLCVFIRLVSLLRAAAARRRGGAAAASGVAASGAAGA